MTVVGLLLPSKRPYFSAAPTRPALTRNQFAELNKRVRFLKIGKKYSLTPEERESNLDVYKGVNWAITKTTNNTLL